MKKILASILLGMTTAALLAGTDVKPQPAPLSDIYQQFIEKSSDGNPAWKTEIRLGADVNKPPAAPYKLYYSDALGYYSYRAKHWDELNEFEQFAVQNDPRMPHFIREKFGREVPKPQRIAALSPQPAAPLSPQPVAAPSIQPVAAPSAPAALVQPKAHPIQTAAIERKAAEDISVAPPSIEAKRVDLSTMDRGLLVQRDGAFVYRFDPDDLVSTKPIRLVEVSKSK